MQKLKTIKWLPVLMAIAILGIAAFQVYWLMNTYNREKKTLERSTNMLFRETVFSLQAAKLKLEKIVADSGKTTHIQIHSANVSRKSHLEYLPDDKLIRFLNVLSEKAKNPTETTTAKFNQKISGGSNSKGMFASRKKLLMQFLYDMDSIQDSVTVKEVHSALEKRMQQQNFNIPFTVSRLKTPNDGRVFNEVTVGFAHPITYKLSLVNTFPYLVRRISASVFLSLFIVGFTTICFVLLYRNLLKQRRLAEIKNEFISNITHELKTPIATVSVAIEALRSFNATMDQQRTKEYLEISSNELHRLSLLVDKVLKLSVFEKKEVDLKYETLDLRDLVAEVTSSMQLQFEKHNASVKISSEGNTQLQGDRLHLVSVIFNLLDNALKYSSGQPEIEIIVKGGTNKVSLCICDNGIGIPAEYQNKVFEKFFRVPTGNLHNAKGYGLGLSYVAHVVNRHDGTIKVDSIEGDGSKFTITLPKHNAG
ncbi:MAG: HAMP domain-containing histidine kinase [Chitinophagaceae bacterium]|nr:HAMP domain-containing histidine kinase [Chitinophagaceae bacterium]